MKSWLEAFQHFSEANKDRSRWIKGFSRFLPSFDAFELIVDSGVNVKALERVKVFYDESFTFSKFANTRKFTKNFIHSQWI